MIINLKSPYQLECIACKKQTQEQDTYTNCLDCGNPLDVVYDYDQIKQRLNAYGLQHSPISALKYLDLYPIHDFNKIVTLQEGGTPLQYCKNLSKELGIKNLYVKNEGANPTGVFKDRGTMVEVTKALELGAEAICLASTGNMAASVSAYSSVAGLPCYVLVPEGTPAGKLAQVISFGGRVMQIRSDYSECARLAEKMAERYGFYLAGDYAFRLEGQKSQAYEIVEQLGWKVPDYVICPVGCGTNMSAIWKGFKEFKTLGLINRLPKMVAVQANGCNVIVKAFKENKEDFEVQEKVESVCSAVCAGNPLDGKKVLKALYDSKGMAVQIDDDTVLSMQKKLAKAEAIFLEPSGVLPLAAVELLKKEGWFKDNEIVVCIGTGNGLKDPKSAVKNISEPPRVDPDMEDIDHFITRKLYNIYAKTISNKEEKLWHQVPEASELQIMIEKEFEISLSAEEANTIRNYILNYQEKGKKISKQDLQNIIEECINIPDEARQLEVLDFQTSTSKHAPAEAKVKVRFGDKELEEISQGVGMVDAIITAMKKAIAEHDKLEMQLSDYKVEIFTGGVDATVRVEISAKDKKGNHVTAPATSPDVIVASIKAFENCYNLLWSKANRHELE